MNATFFRQCRLIKRLGPTSEAEQTSWIPERYARVGNVLKLRDESGAWEGGWVATHIGARSLPEDKIPGGHKFRKAIRA